MNSCFLWCILNRCRVKWIFYIEIRGICHFINWKEDKSISTELQKSVFNPTLLSFSNAVNYQNRPYIFFMLQRRQSRRNSKKWSNISRFSIWTGINIKISSTRFWCSPPLLPIPHFVLCVFYVILQSPPPLIYFLSLPSYHNPSSTGAFTLQ